MGVRMLVPVHLHHDYRVLLGAVRPHAPGSLPVQRISTAFVRGSDSARPLYLPPFLQGLSVALRGPITGDHLG
jgi:hypothetical protein